MQNISKKIFQIFENSPIKIILVIVVFFISSFFTILQGSSFVSKVIKEKLYWRNTEYSKINSVRPGMNIDYFNEVFGVANYKKISEKNQYLTIHTFKERDYWVQAVASNSGTVLLYTVTSCSEKFKPNINPNPIQSNITLQKSTLSQIGTEPQSLNYFIGNTANTYFYDEYFLGNPSFYERVFVGINDVCPPYLGTNDLFIPDEFTIKKDY